MNSTFGKFLFLNGASKIGISGLLCVGDSTIRFFEQHIFLKCAMAGVVSKGGALVHEVTNLLSRCLKKFRPGFVFVHAGVNNLSKTYLYQNEKHQLASTKSELAGLENVISQYAAGVSGMRVILSSVTATKDGRVNARATDINEHIELCCAKNGWLFMDNKNFATKDLRFTVHFNKSGEEKFLANLQDSICRSIG